MELGEEVPVQPSSLLRQHVQDDDFPASLGKSFGQKTDEASAEQLLCVPFGTLPRSAMGLDKHGAHCVKVHHGTACPLPGQQCSYRILAGRGWSRQYQHVVLLSECACHST